MGRTFRYGDEDDEKILGHGDRLVVPMAMMDGSMDHPDPLQRAVVTDQLRLARITDGAGNTSLHKPGFRISNTITRDRSIYDSYDAEIATAYKNVGAGEREALGQRVDRQEDAASVKDDRGSAYQEFENRIQNAWRNP